MPDGPSRRTVARSSRWSFARFTIPQPRLAGTRKSRSKRATRTAASNASARLFPAFQQLSIPRWSPLRLFLGLHQQVARAGRRFAPSDIDRGEFYRLFPVPHRSRSAEALGPVRSRRRSTVDRQSCRRLAGEIPRRCWRCRPWERPAGPW